MFGSEIPLTTFVKDRLRPQRAPVCVSPTACGKANALGPVSTSNAKRKEKNRHRPYGLPEPDSRNFMHHRHHPPGPPCLFGTSLLRFSHDRSSLNWHFRCLFTQPQGDNETGCVGLFG